MKVISANKIYYGSAPPVVQSEGGSNIDGSSTPTDIKAFQNYVEAKHGDYAEKVGTGQYGKWDRLTGDAWKKFGVEYDNLKVGKKVKKELKKVKEDIKKEKAQDEKGWKTLSKSAKIGIIAGGSLMVIGIVIMITTSTKNK